MLHEVPVLRLHAWPCQSASEKLLNDPDSTLSELRCKPGNGRSPTSDSFLYTRRGIGSWRNRMRRDLIERHHWIQVYRDMWIRISTTRPPKNPRTVKRNPGSLRLSLQQPPKKTAHPQQTPPPQTTNMSFDCNASPRYTPGKRHENHRLSRFTVCMQSTFSHKLGDWSLEYRTESFFHMLCAHPEPRPLATWIV